MVDDALKALSPAFTRLYSAYFWFKRRPQVLQIDSLFGFYCRASSLVNGDGGTASRVRSLKNHETLVTYFVTRD
jgi:hypothetical protein